MPGALARSFANRTHFPWAEKGMNSGFETGDLINGYFCFASYQYFQTSCMCSTDEYAIFVLVNTIEERLGAAVSIQYVLNLQTRQPQDFLDLTCLNGEVMNEDK
jgi:hypothetical protein